MDPVTTSALIGAGASVAGSTASGLFKPSLRRQWKYQQKQMNLQQQYALEQLSKQAELNYQNWQKQFDYENEYNDPSKVFERYLKAGVTPAAVLGSSGVGVSATMSPSGAGTGGASGPSAGSLDFSNPVPGLGSTAASAVTGMMQARASSERDRAAADRDRAEADDIRSKMQTPDYYAAVADLNKSVLASNVNNAEAVARMNAALADIYQADASYADLSATYKFQDLVATYSKHVEEYNEIRKWNVDYMDKVYSAQIALDYARAYEASASGDLSAASTELTQVRLADLQKWFELNWETEIDVPQVTASGKPTGKTVKLTGKQIQAHLMGLSASAGSQELAGKWFQNRSEKNAFGYQMARTALQGAIAVGGAYAGGKALRVPTVSESTTEHYDSDGAFIGGTMVRKSEIRGRKRR